MPLATRSRWCASCNRTWWSHDILTLARRSRRSCSISRAPRSSPTSIPRPARAFRSTRSGPACRVLPPAAPAGSTPSCLCVVAWRAGVWHSTTRASRLGLPPLSYPHGGISRELALVATFPQLEYPRTWPAHVHVVGPLMWEPPAEEVQLPRRATIRLCSSHLPPPKTLDAPPAACRLARCCAERRLCACSRPTNRRLPSRLARPGQRHRSWTGSPTPAPCPTATRSSATPATARSSARSSLRRSGCRLPDRRRHERERRASRVGRGRHPSATPLHLSATASACGRVHTWRPLDPCPRQRACGLGVRARCWRSRCSAYRATCRSSGFAPEYADCSVCTHLENPEAWVDSHSSHPSGFTAPVRGGGIL